MPEGSKRKKPHETRNMVDLTITGNVELTPTPLGERNRDRRRERHGTKPLGKEGQYTYYAGQMVQQPARA